MPSAGMRAINLLVAISGEATCEIMPPASHAAAVTIAATPPVHSTVVKVYDANEEEKEEEDMVDLFNDAVELARLYNGRNEHAPNARRRDNDLDDLLDGRRLDRRSRAAAGGVTDDDDGEVVVDEGPLVLVSQVCEDQQQYTCSSLVGTAVAAVCSHGIGRDRVAV